MPASLFRSGAPLALGILSTVAAAPLAGCRPCTTCAAAPADDGPEPGDSVVVEEQPLVSCATWPATTDSFAIDGVAASGWIYVLDGPDLVALGLDGTGLTAYWTFTDDAGDAFTGVALRGGSLYAATDGGRLFSLAPSTGDEHWRLVRSNDALGPPAIATDGTIVVRSLDNFLYALEPTAGAELWRTPAGDHLSRPVLGPDDTVYLVALASNGPLWAIDPATGIERWTFEPDGLGDYELTQPVIAADGSVILFVRRDTGDILYALRAADRYIQWQLPVADNPGPALGPGDRIYLADDNGGLRALSAADGAELWQQSIGTADAAATDLLVVGEGADHEVVTLSDDGVHRSIVAVASAGGAIAWSIDTTDAVFSPGAHPDGYLLVGDGDGFVHALQCP